MNDALLHGIMKLIAIFAFSYIIGNALATLHLKRKKKLLAQQSVENNDKNAIVFYDEIQ